ncbi:MAG: hypothetical protein M1819_002711 [Sarea resinae]|nr:MAG: hypothetical protein M1819_002711 [Sarea resinae]
MRSENPDDDGDVPVAANGLHYISITSPRTDRRVSASTHSLDASVLDYRIENGRRYHRYHEGSYYYPNDDLENDRLDLQYTLFKRIMRGRAYFAPIQNPKKILDLGTGTGRWPVEMADMFPNAEITGTDLSPIQPEWVPSNVHFVIDDAAEKDWLYPPSTFSYIHTRLLLGSFNDFRHIIRTAFHHLQLGGYLESQDFMPTLYCDDGSLPTSWPFLEWTRYVDDASMAYGRPLRIANKLKRWYEEAGFVDVQERIIKVPLGSWPKDERLKSIGILSRSNFLDGLQAMSLAPFTRALGWSKNELEVYLVGVRRSLMDRSVHAYHKAFVVWGRKPDLSPSPSDYPATPTSSAAPLPLNQS